MSLKKFAMAVMFIAGFQQVSADVCKLKVKKEIVEALNKYDDLGEVWVNKNNGGVYEGSFDGGVHIISVNKISTAFNGNGGLKDEYKNAIFCNDKGEVVINVDGANNRQEEAKRQFENIIRSGLVKENIINTQIYNTPFTDNTKWKMPGISADISSIANQNTTTVPVMCAMKVDTLYRIDCLSKNQLKQYANEVDGFVISKRSRKDVNAILNTEGNFSVNVNGHTLTFNEIRNAIGAVMCEKDIIKPLAWEKIFLGRTMNVRVHNIEHTERQLLLYHLSKTNEDKWLAKDGYSDIKISFKYPSELLIYSNGAPCFDEFTTNMYDNCGMCCWNLYRQTKKNLKMSVYFSTLAVNALVDSTKMKNMFEFSDYVKYLSRAIGVSDSKITDCVNAHNKENVEKYGLTKHNYDFLSCISHEEFAEAVNQRSGLTEGKLLTMLTNSYIREHTKEKLFDRLFQMSPWRQKHTNITFKLVPLQ